MLLHSKFDKKEIQTEKNVVIEEITMDRDHPSHHVAELAYSALFSGNRLSQPVGGSDETIKNYTHSDIIKYYKYFYRPENMVISIASNISFKKIVNFISKQSISKIKTDKPTIHEFFSDSNEDINKDVMILKNMKLDHVHMALGFRICGRHNTDVYALKLLEVILASNMSSLLFTNLREKHGLTYSVSVFNSAYQNHGGFIILTSVDKTKLFNKGRKKGAFDVVIETLLELYKNGVSLKQLKLAKGFLKGMLTLSLENSDTITAINGSHHLFDNNDKDVPLTELYNLRYKHLTRASINKVIRKYILKKNIGSAFIGTNITKTRKIISTKLNKFK